MPDIAMCRAGNCPLSTKCYRHEDSGTVPDKYRQSYVILADDDPVGYDCDLFWERD